MGTASTTAECIIKNKLGLHARPASLFVQTATKNDAVVKLMKEEFKSIEVVRGGSVGIESISIMER